MNLQVMLPIAILFMTCSYGVAADLRVPPDLQTGEKAETGGGGPGTHPEHSSESNEGVTIPDLPPPQIDPEIVHEPPTMPNPEAVIPPPKLDPEMTINPERLPEYPDFPLDKPEGTDGEGTPPK